MKPLDTERWKEALDLGDPDERIFAPLLKLHLHPQTSGPLDLSLIDIYGVDADSVRVPVAPICGVGTIDDSGQGYLLLFRKTVATSLKRTCRSVLEQAWHQYQKAEDLWPSKELARAMEVPGFLRAGVINYSIRADRKRALLQDLNDLRRLR